MQEFDKARIVIEATERYTEDDRRMRELEEGELLRRGMGGAALFFFALMFFGSVAMLVALAVSGHLR